MFPSEKTYFSLGTKLGHINNNLFLNDYLYNVLGEEASKQKSDVVKEYLRIDDKA